VDDSDVLQESFLEVSRRLNEYVREPQLPFYLWLRHMTGASERSSSTSCSSAAAA